ncbi:Superfamily II DNA or RNA helicase, SNF2 family [Selenomonas ruminantium]|uniref:Superfamily II DNA or RNA helicase, SNF2 family n=1 Tax=Selenomonas ruminantium TaxID=971 RepID=A0A1M6TVX4_SELRU|nr:DEAD/DEAH box helicase [Selenomonas ruminantium]SHK61091.1 Superfamily II DNA or RNA helicase, SNF2 family [Selenomonas ruminantium]
MLKDIMIQSVASSDTVYRRGVKYYKEYAVEDLESLDDAGREWTATVYGSTDYHVYVKLDKKREDVADYNCDCPAAEQYLGACKHVVAVLKEIQEKQENEHPQSAREILQNVIKNMGLDTAGNLQKKMKQEQQTRAAQRMFAAFQQADEEEQDGRPVGQTEYAHLVPRLVTESYYGNHNNWLEFRFGLDKLYVVKNVSNFLEAMEKGAEWQLGTKSTINLGAVHWGDEISARLYAMLQKYNRLEQGLFAAGASNSRYYYMNTHSYLFEQKQFRLSPEALAEFLELMGESSFEVRIDDGEWETVRTRKGNPQLALALTENHGGGELRVMKADIAVLSTDCRITYQDGVIYQSDRKYARGLKPLVDAFDGTTSIRISSHDMAAFFGQVLPRMELAAKVDIAPEFLEQYVVHPLAAELYIDYEGDGIAVRPRFAYGDAVFNPLVEREPPLRGGRKLVRDERSEQELITRLTHYGFQPKRDQLVQKDEEKSYEFLTEELPFLPDWVEVFYSDAFANRPVRPMPKVTAGVSVNDMDLLEVTFNAKDLDFNELMDILDSYRQKRKYHRLKDKSFITLGEQQMQAIADFVDNTGIGKSKAEGMKVELPMNQALYLDELARADENLRLERSRQFRAIVRDIRHPEDGETEVPASLKNILRDYQVTGFNWLSNLASYHLGGILADDMGLGKTLQVIAFLLSKQDYQQPPSLVVAPTSLMYNWLDEIERFAPELKACAVAGTKAEREKILAEADASYDVLITTYNMMKRDIDMYEKRKFRYAFLDEAQHIKNPATQNARAVKRLKTSGYFALTGTPIENTLTELWSIFDFLMPGYLLSHKKFKEHYETPIVREQDSRSLTDLKRHVMPFILRRMKKDVLTELPDKVERKMVSSMTPKQEKVYQGWFLKSQKEFAQQLASGEDSRIKILAILTRLRQIACDPAMFLEGYTGGSGKLDQLEEIVGEAVDGGHRILIFSQFTTMLGHIGERLKQQGIGYYYLDGSTPSLERIRLVKAFNEGATPVFLISLKAGGTGLNLTGADMVIHFDPWWNPAVEDQATDRAYRLGQKNNVQVIRMLAKGTVEEKIYELQQKKKSLIDQMIQPGENFLSKLTDEEIRELFQK